MSRRASAPLNEDVMRRLRERGHGELRQAIDDTRAARAEVAELLAGELGARRVETLRRGLLHALEAAGGMEAVRARRVPPVR